MISVLDSHLLFKDLFFSKMDRYFFFFVRSIFLPTLNGPDTNSAVGLAADRQIRLNNFAGLPPGITFCYKLAGNNHTCESRMPGQEQVVIPLYT